MERAIFEQAHAINEYRRGLITKENKVSVSTSLEKPTLLSIFLIIFLIYFLPNF